MITRPPMLRASRAKESLLVGIEDRHEGHLGQVEPLAKEVDADEDVVNAEPKIAEDLDPLEGVDLRVEPLDLDAQLGQVVGKVLGHLLREGRDEDSLATLDRRADL